MKQLALNIANNSKHISGLKNPHNFSIEDKRKLAKATKDFEALLTSMMLKNMMPKDGGMFGDNALGGKYFDTIFNMQLSQYMSEQKGFGVAEKIYEKVVGEKFDPSLMMKSIKMPKAFKIDVTNNSSEVLKPGTSTLNRLQKYEPIIREAANTFGVSDSLIKSVIVTESAAKPDVISRANAKGLMQLIDSTAKDMGVSNVFDPKENIFGGTKYLSILLDEFDNDMDKALAAYNAGPHNVKKHNGIPPFKETQNYVKKIKAYHNFFKD